MSGRDSLIDRQNESALAAALRALPDAAPQPDLWPGLERSFGKRRARVWHYALPAALAAGLALALLVPRTPSHEGVAPVASSAPATAAPVPTSNTANTEELTQLRERSQTLERWIGAIAARAPQNSRDLMAAVEVEDMIGLVDVQLAATDPAATLPLWRRRVALLQDLAMMRYGANLMQLDGGLAVNEAAADRNGAAPATWNN